MIKDVLSYVTLEGLTGYILLLDFEKAFDSIEWPFMMKCQQKCNMGSKFIKWIKILHNQTQSCVSNNGYLSEYFYLGRGIRQGCPISALLFTPQPLRAVGVLFSPMVSGWAGDGKKFVRPVSQKP